ncbi:MAG TPA: EamA family transporter, partial [Gammaproteobacteria bacterium]|nr:EamA family transporter [Gammaproteobacteria bacterium]
SLGLITIPASIAALFSGFTPIATSLGAFFWLDEKFGLYDAVGLLLVILSIVIGARGGKSFLGSLFRFRFAKTISEVSSTE